MSFKIGDEVWSDGKKEVYYKILKPLPPWSFYDVKFFNTISVKLMVRHATLIETDIRKHGFKRRALDVACDAIDERFRELDEDIDDLGRLVNINPHRPKVEKTCTCTSRDLFNFGCKCGAIERYDKDKYWKK